MKKNGILNAELIMNIAKLGHKDSFLIADAGMPIPKGVTVIDLSLCQGIPEFKQVLKAILNETEIEKFCYAEEMEEFSEENFTYMLDALVNIESSTMGHDALKQLSEACKFAIKTGECTPFSNVILTSGVIF